MSHYEYYELLPPIYGVQEVHLLHRVVRLRNRQRHTWRPVVSGRPVSPKRLSTIANCEIELSERSNVSSNVGTGGLWTQADTVNAKLLIEPEQS